MAESTIITGQFVRISQVPASLGERILARIIDYFLLFIYILATSYISVSYTHLTLPTKA